tara:strand:+ start:3357 stop:4040 length:684 start_codon:yes stop_codon:yes gene_type:complete
MKNINRETWLNFMIDKAVPLFDDNGFKISDIRNKLKVSCSMMVGQRKSSKFKAIGQHLPPNWSANKNHEMLISPTLIDSVQVVGVLIHEMVHAIQSYMYHDKKGNLNVKPHGKEFRKIALSVGLQGKMTATTESPELKIKIEKWIAEIGCQYPHDKINFDDRKKQSTRMLKVECSALHCNNHFRTSRAKILNYANNICNACGGSTMYCIDEPLMVSAIEKNGIIHYE